MEQEIAKLQRTKQNFQSLNPNPRLFYTYIAPKSKENYNRFYEIVSDQPTLSGSLFEILSNDKLIKKILTDNFPKNTELEIYIASNDAHSSLMINDSLKNYIEKENIKFHY